MKRLILAVLVFAPGCFSDVAAADMEQAVRDAARLSRYELPVRLPRVIELSTDQIDLKVPPIAGRSAYGFYDHRRKTVFLGPLSGLDEVEAHSWVIHEAVHYLQDMNGRDFTRCMTGRRLLEAEAYHVQNKYLKSKGYRTVAWSAHLHPCEGAR